MLAALLNIYQVINAKELIEKVWEQNEFWENLVKDEFIG
jgi:hypothetical protein